MNWLDAVILIIIIAAALRGAISGLIMQLASLAGVILGAIFAGQLSNYIAPRIIQHLNTSPSVTGVLSYLVAFLLIFIGMFFIGKAIESAVKALKMNPLNRIGGAGFCILKWILVISIILNLVVELDQKQSIVKKEIREHSIGYPLVIETARIAAPFLRFDWVKDNFNKNHNNTQTAVPK